jgi:hypothetical protein
MEKIDAVAALAALAREFEIGAISGHVSATASARLKSDVPLDFLVPPYGFATPGPWGPGCCESDGGLWAQRHQCELSPYLGDGKGQAAAA